MASREISFTQFLCVMEKVHDPQLIACPICLTLHLPTHAQRPRPTPFFPPLLSGQRFEQEIEHNGPCGTGRHLWPMINKNWLAYNEHSLSWQHRSEHQITLNCGPNPPMSLPLDAASIRSSAAQLLPASGQARLTLLILVLTTWAYLCEAASYASVGRDVAAHAL
ncbi:hypothetical protein PG993_008859 [Apiospora rasikravindrae]|uniref:Uncharacterized protein n=1 Tax=Apiospora rasikravindrae TaxID=990691 RepID=A0ABR1SR97_9PEZI